MANRRKRLKRLMWCVPAVIAAVLWLTVMPKIQAARREKAAFEGALALYEQGAYEEAMTAAKTLSDDPRAECLYNICDAHLWYEKDRIGLAHSALYDYDVQSLTEYGFESEQPFFEKVMDEFAAWKAELEAEAAESYRQELEKGLPFVGMLESDIGNTDLGEPSPEVKQWSETVNGKSVFTNVYEFIQQGKVIFTVQCLDGKAIGVWDNRNVLKNGCGGKRADTTEEDDPYNTNDYRNEEDFYEAHYYDFFDYEDAADYYRDHKQ